MPSRAYVTRYKLDLEVQTVATEYRIYSDENGKFHIPNELKDEVFYGKKSRQLHMTLVIFLHDIDKQSYLCYNSLIPIDSNEKNGK